MISKKEELTKSLKTEWDAVEKRNSIYYVDCCLDVLVEALEKCIGKLGWDIENISKSYDYKYGYKFMVVYGEPEDAAVLSKHLPNILVVGCENWDCFDVRLYKNGGEALRSREYRMFFEYEKLEDESGEPMWQCYAEVFNEKGNFLFSEVGNIVSKEVLKENTERATKTREIRHVDPFRATIEERLSEHFPGGRDQYSVFIVEKRKEAAIDGICEACKELGWEPEQIYKWDDEKRSFSFKVVGGHPEDARVLSRCLDTLVLGEDAWDSNEFQIFKSGKVAEKRKDYFMIFAYEPSDEQQSPITEWDTFYKLYGSDKKLVGCGGCGCISTEALEHNSELATRTQKGIVIPDGKN